ncbi:acyl-CoA dehydrogenase [Halorubrum sp. JWXQ-INN 858]|uniref:acyl-CoA dehydrogenase n=1 Tax=Halorubrum sp. JWXQ-INN 858 TaxID=2690782 RepID=UPI00135B4729|nr:acyl-CoA dehydrogenase [Halorubrum sp. JWXQ-INN 858]MWV65506.1 acyl-CoA dehydrogenase [Halorubrum sp. JWXQ-INN 858]
MSNFKSGSGNLDFGAEKERSNDEADGADDADDADGVNEDAREGSADSTTEPTAERTASDTATDDATGSETERHEYPYFVRRSNVGDERDTRLEIHVRDEVAEGEAAFRNELAERLETNEVSKTDAREFALLAAFRHPERVAELMRDEGFGAL